jgi:glyoxylase-like metal-dependent hydrolase (beta-lactamase superfamily II)
MFGRDFPEPSEFPVPDRVVENGDQLRLGGVTVAARVLLNAHTPASVVWELPDQRVVFTGDVAIDRKTPSLRSGTSSAYLTDLDMIVRSTEGFSMSYPGHGNPATPAGLIDQTR